MRTSTITIRALALLGLCLPAGSATAQNAAMQVRVDQGQARFGR